MELRRFVAYVAGGRGVQRIRRPCNETPFPAMKGPVLQRNGFSCNERACAATKSPCPATKRLLVKRIAPFPWSGLRLHSASDGSSSLASGSGRKPRNQGKSAESGRFFLAFLILYPLFYNYIAHERGIRQP